MCVCVTCVLNSSPRLVNRYSYPYAALQLSHTTWYGLWLIQFPMSSKIPFRQTSCTHTEKKIYKQYDLNIPAVPFNPVFIPETYPSRNLVEPWIVESRVQINALNILHSENRKKYHKYHKLLTQKEQMGQSTLPLYYVLFKFELFLYEILTLTQMYKFLNIHCLVLQNFWEARWDRKQWRCTTGTTCFQSADVQFSRRLHQPTWSLLCTARFPENLQTGTYTQNFMSQSYF